MIRAVAISCLTALLILVLYLPSTQPPEAFMRQVRNEHAINADFWSRSTADRILARMMQLREHASESALNSRSLPNSTGAGVVADRAPHGTAPSAVDAMWGVNERIFGSAYLKAIDALLVLASYRLATLMEWVPLTWVFAIALLVDALFERVLKTKQLRHHSPEMFAIYVSLAIMTLCAAALALVCPWSLHPSFWASLPSAVSLLISRAIAHFHRWP